MQEKHHYSESTDKRSMIFFYLERTERKTNGHKLQNANNFEATLLFDPEHH